MISFLINYWLEFLMGIISTGLIAGYKYLFNKQRAVANGVKALLRHEIVQCCNHYREKGYCPIYALENIESMYTEYKVLGGNGTIPTLIKEMHELPRERKQD